jgi:hypothetical protein
MGVFLCTHFCPEIIAHESKIEAEMDSLYFSCSFDLSSFTGDNITYQFIPELKTCLNACIQKRGKLKRSGAYRRQIVSYKNHQLCSG